MSKIGSHSAKDIMKYNPTKKNGGTSTTASTAVTTSLDYSINGNSLQNNDLPFIEPSRVSGKAAG